MRRRGETRMAAGRSRREKKVSQIRVEIVPRFGGREEGKKEAMGWGSRLAVLVPWCD